MNKPSKLFLTSGFCMVMIAPAIADIASDNSNPTCDATTIGASSGNTSLDAVWNLVNQTCESGKYFDMTSATCVTCTSNNYCPGGTYSVESQDNGLNSCPAGYGLSASGASAQTDCYRTCTTNDVAHSTAVSGGYYYGNNNQCSAESCALGWQTQENLDLSNLDEGTDYAAYIKLGNEYYTYNDLQQSESGLTERYSYAVKFDNVGMVYGLGWCSKKNDSDTYDTLTNETGRTNAKYCYCNITGYKPNNGQKQDISSSWVYRGSYNETTCGRYCTKYCAAWIRSEPEFRTALSDTIAQTPTQCVLTEKSCVAGEYFDETAIMCKTCDANHYCPGGVYSVESETFGKNNCPSGYGLSTTGNASQNGCYRNCTTSDVAHATGVSGAYYYGNNNQCGATSCAAGWHVKRFNLAEEYNTTNPTNSSTAYINNDGTYGSNDLEQSESGLTERNTWAVKFDNLGIVYGSARCSKTPGNTSPTRTTFNSLTDETGEADAIYCYCNITGYKPVDGQKQNLSSPWTFEYAETITSCAAGCSNACTYRARYYHDWFSAAEGVLASCEANTINIDWYNMDTIHEQNQCTYSESITLPETNPQRTGYNFTGWSVRPASTPTTTE